MKFKLQLSIKKKVYNQLIIDNYDENHAMDKPNMNFEFQLPNQ